MGTDGARDGDGAAAAGAPEVTVRTGTATDAPAAARLHATRIADGFLSFLGPSFLTRLYRRVARTPDSFLVVAEIDGGVVGFIAGSADVGDLYRTFLVRDGVVAGLSAAPRLIREWRRVLETLRHGGGGGSGAGRGTELLAVAVDPGHAGRGVGAALVAAFLERMVTSGGHEAYVVVGAANTGAIGLYDRAGFASAGEFELHAGTTSLVMQWHSEPA